MAANAINNLFGGLNSPGFGLGNMGGLGLASTIKPPQLERYHEEHGWTKSSKGKKGNVALSALTLLAFLFFLHILQSCIQEHMYEMKGKDKYNYGNKQQLLNSFANIQLPNIIIVDSSSSSSDSDTDARNAKKGDDGQIRVEEEMNKWPLQANAQFKEAQKRVLKKNARSKKKNANRQGQHFNNANNGNAKNAKINAHLIVNPVNQEQGHTSNSNLNDVPNANNKNTDANTQMYRIDNENEE